MRLSIKTHLLYSAPHPCDVLVQIEPFSNTAQSVTRADFRCDPTSTEHEIKGEEGLGTRRWLEVDHTLDCHFEADVVINRRAATLEGLALTPRVGLPSDVIKYLMPSRYCHPEQFLEFVSSQFGTLTGGALVRAMSDWIATQFTYDSAASALGATATDSFQNLSGVCRDYAHVLITFARAAGIPARFVSVYAPDVIPQDFHAVVEVYLDGAWHLIDPTGMAQETEMACICVGRDATDASFLTSYGWIELRSQSVEVHRIVD